MISLLVSSEELVARANIRYTGLLSRLHDSQLSDTADGVLYNIVDNALIDPGPSDKAVINTSSGVRNLLSSSELQQETRALIGLDTNAECKSTLFTVFNGSEFGPFLEVAENTRFMPRDLGPDLGSLGVSAISHAVTPQNDPLDAISNLSAIKSFLESLDYIGEVVFCIGADFKAINFQMGHFPKYMAVYSELISGGPRNIYDFVAGYGPSLTVAEGEIVSTVVSKHPFPMIVDIGRAIPYPTEAQRHIWRDVVFSNYKGVLGAQHILYVTARGADMSQLRGRIIRTVNTVKSYEEYLQCRLDIAPIGEFMLRENHEL